MFLRGREKSYSGKIPLGDEKRAYPSEREGLDLNLMEKCGRRRALDLSGSTSNLLSRRKRPVVAIRFFYSREQKKVTSNGKKRDKRKKGEIVQQVIYKTGGVEGAYGIE